MWFGKIPKKKKKKKKKKTSFTSLITSSPFSTNNSPYNTTSIHRVNSNNNGANINIIKTLSFDKINENFYVLT